MSRPGGHHFKTPTELREMLLKANVSRGRRMICYDGSGVAAA
jgi:3-mercaptopyruvate sulfurtransferase SseA